MSEKKKVEIDDRFKRFGTVSFTSVTKVNDFIGHLEEGRVMGTRCPKCGAVYFPPRADCSQCFSSPTEWFEIEGTGTLLAFSRLKYAPVGFEDDLPYSIAVVDYGSYKVFGRISGDVPEEEIEIGMSLKTAASTLPNGQLNYVFQRA
jgi:uncharacterized OB-fold protein